MARSVKHLVVHCAATPPGMDIGRREIAQWHRARGWRDIGYHFVIRRNGRLERGRHLNKDHVLDTSEMGAHVAGHNATSVGICLVGGVDDAGKPANNFTEPQFRRLREVLAALSVQFPDAEIVGHRDLFKGKACPSFDVRGWLAGEPELEEVPAGIDALVQDDPADDPVDEFNDEEEQG